MSTRLTFTMVIIGDIIAMAAWIWGYDKLYNYNCQFVIILLLIIFALAIGGVIYANIRKRKQ